MISINTSKDNLNLDYIYEYLSTSYWAHDRSKQEVKSSIEHSLCFGMYDDGRHIGFARVVTDQVSFSYLMDLFIDDKYLGRGLGSRLLEYIYEDSRMIDVKKHYLRTKDAQEFYEKHGFRILEYPERTMVMGR